MGRRSIGGQVFRSILGLSMVTLMTLLYWSSVLVEEHVLDLIGALKAIEKDLGDLKRDHAQMRSDLRRVNRDAEKFARQKALSSSYDDVHRASIPSFVNLTDRPHVDSSFANLLTPDPYYQKVLPESLPEGFSPSGTRRLAIVGKPDHLHPFSNWSHVSSWVSQCTVAVAKMHVGRYETMGPDMALKMELRTDEEGRPVYWIHLRDGVFWHPLDPDHLPEDLELADHFFRQHQVTAHDFKFYFDALMNPWVQEAGAVSLRNYLGDIEELRVIDDLTFTVRWKTESVIHNDGSEKQEMKYIAKSWTGNLTPLASWLYQYFPDGSKILDVEEDLDTYRKDSVWAQNFNQHWARNIIPSCGAWIFDGMSDRQIAFRRNPDHYAPLENLVEGMEIGFKETPDALWQDFKAGKLDTYALRPDQLLELEDFLQSEDYIKQAQGGEAIHRLDYLGRSYSYIGWNQASPLFDNPRVRRALTMAIDRRRIVEQNLNDLGVETTGPFHVMSKSYDTTIQPWTFDPRKSRRLLSRNGWYDSNADGIVDKKLGDERIPFSFSLTYYVKNPTSKAIGEYVKLALKDVDIDCDLNGVDIADLSQKFEDKDFDAILLGWSQGSPPEEPRQLWHSSGAHEKGSSNAIGFAHSEVDEIIEALQYEYDSSKREKLYHRFHQIIHEQSPYTFLYAPKAVFLYRDYVQNVFIPAERQDLIPDADVAQPQASLFWLRARG